MFFSWIPRCMNLKHYTKQLKQSLVSTSTSKGIMRQFLDRLLQCPCQQNNKGHKLIKIKSIKEHYFEHETGEKRMKMKCFLYHVFDNLTGEHDLTHNIILRHQGLNPRLLRDNPVTNQFR